MSLALVSKNSCLSVVEVPTDKPKKKNRTSVKKSLSPLKQTPFVQSILEKADFPTIADLKVLYLVSKLGIPAYYDSHLRSIVLHSQAVKPLKNAWASLRESIAKPLADLPVERHKDEDRWVNSARTVDELYKDELRGSELFFNITKAIAEKTGGQLCFGPGNKNIVKSKSSIQSKVDRAAADAGADEAFAVQHVEDGVRGTIVFGTMKDLRNAYEQFVKICKQNNILFSASNLWDPNIDYSGYVDIDVRLLLKFKDQNQGDRIILAELQFHLDSFFDGSKDCVVSRAHKIYEIIRMVPVIGMPTDCEASYEDLVETSRLYFTTSLFLTAQKSNNPILLELF